MTSTVYFVTGGSRGIGLEFVNQLIKRDNAIVFAGVRTLASLDNIYPSSPKNLHIVQCNVTSDESVLDAAATVSRLTGRVDVLINNAGIDNHKSIRDTDVAGFKEILETNLVGPHRVTRAFLPLILNSHIKKVINVSSDFGSITLNDRVLFGAYSTSKAALNMLTVSYKNDYAKEGVIFIPLHPGDVY